MVLSMASGIALGQRVDNDQNFNFHWKIDQGRKLIYKTSIDRVEKAYNGATINRSDSIVGTNGTLFTNINGKEVFFTHISQLAPDSLKVVIASDKKENGARTIFLQGMINQKGNEIGGLYNQDTRNWTDLIFSLPDTAIKKGGSWKLDVQLIQLNESFSVEKYTSMSKGTLMDVYTEENQMFGVFKLAVEQKAIFSTATDVMGNPGKTNFMDVRYSGQMIFNYTKGQLHTFSKIYSPFF